MSKEELGSTSLPKSQNLKPPQAGARVTPNYVTAHQYTLLMTSLEDNFNCMADSEVIALMSVDPLVGQKHLAPALDRSGKLNSMFVAMPGRLAKDRASSVALSGMSLPGAIRIPQSLLA